ncbi:hypothetical protein ACFL6U_23330 [Planctomycetota bacterium]
MSHQNANLLKEFRSSNNLIKASIWENVVEENGQTKRRRSIKIQKQYRDSEGEYKDTNIFYVNELPLLAQLAQEAYRFLSMQESQDAVDVGAI